MHAAVFDAPFDLTMQDRQRPSPGPGAGRCLSCIVRSKGAPKTAACMVILLYLAIPTRPSRSNQTSPSSVLPRGRYSQPIQPA